eukprot:TRINITY_DN370_c0_g3_i1.p1 TRINITY_DN370_c0_g3~~TRINITY_DN370_c0_g3_i1.p1  ORF type:complete len:424 (+),score=63.07 TRINITY_DN370_c0_g3_i1:111-1274(+)
MEFRLRAGENLPASSFLSSASTDGYFTTQALRAGYIGTLRSAAADIRARDALQREIEKERIREEIIASEIVRKRVLEEEVRRELAIERGLALQQRPAGTDRFPFMTVSVVSEPRVPGVRVGERGGLQGRSEVRIVERLPFQRNSGAAVGVGASEVKLLPPPAATAFEGSKGGPVVFLGKSPKPNLVGLKRKASDATTAVNENPWLVGPKKVAKEWNCALCQVSTTSEEGLNDHLQGKKHKSKEQLRANKTIAKTKVKQTKKQDEKKQLVGAIAKQVAAKHKTEGVKKRKFAFWCIHCKVGCHSGTVMAAHCRGKKHKAQVQRLEGSGTTASAETHDTVQAVNVVTAVEVKGETEENVDGEVDGVEEMVPEEEEEAAEAAVEHDCTEE